MRRTCNLAAVLLAAGLTLAACGGSGDDDTVAPAGGLVRETLFATATTVPPAAPVDGPVVLDELTGKLKAQAPDAFVEESTTNLSSRWARTVWLRTVGGVTDGQIRLDVYAAPADRDSWVAEFRGATEVGAYLVVGDMWTAAAYNADDAATAQRLLGGELITGGS